MRVCTCTAFGKAWKLLLLGLLLCAAAGLRAQQPDSAARWPARMTLGGAWLWEEADLPVHAPVALRRLDAMRLRYELVLPAPLPSDTLYLVLDGIAWQAQLEVNDRYLGVPERPLARWVAPVHPAWLRPGANEIRLRLRTGGQFPYAPAAFLGMLRPPLLLTRPALDSLSAPLMPQQATADTVAYIAPYYGASGFEFREFEAARILLPLTRLRLRTVAFTFEPGPELRRLCAALGLREVADPGAARYRAMLNAYPYEPVSMPAQPRFWLDERGRRTSYYGDVADAQAPRLPGRPVNRLFVALMILVPAACLFLLKVLSPGMYHAQWTILVSPKLYVDASGDVLTNSSVLLVLTLLRIASLAAFAALSAYLVHHEQAWHLLDAFSRGSGLHRLFYQDSPALSLLGKSFAVLGAGMALKYLLVGWIGGLFRIKNMLARVLALDVLGSYPIVLMLPLLPALLLFAGPPLRGVLAVCSALLIAGFIIRHLYVVYIGLDRALGFTLGVKILYICAFNLLPYLIWL
jgi:hypothetical protein